MKKIFFLSNKLKHIFAFLFFTTFLSGCAGLFIAGLPLDADKHYPHMIGLKVTPKVYPAVIIKGNSGYGIHLPHNEPYGNIVADVPKGTIITIEHIIRKYNVQNDVNDQVVGRIDVPGYSGLVALGVCDGRKKIQVAEDCIQSEKYTILKTPIMTDR